MDDITQSIEIIGTGVAALTGSVIAFRGKRRRYKTMIEDAIRRGIQEQREHEAKHPVVYDTHQRFQAYVQESKANIHELGLKIPKNLEARIKAVL
jgi:hypothetical protein